MDKEFYIEWLFIMGKNARSYYEKMNLDELEAEYNKVVEGRGEDGV